MKTVVTSQQVEAKNMETVDIIVPEHFLLSAANLGVTTVEAFCEIVDNSWDAKANDINIWITEEDGDIVLRFSDDGIGMSSDFIPTAISFGGSGHYNNRQKIGRFGWGLPASAVCQADRLEVYSKQKGDSFYMSYLDVDEMSKKHTGKIPSAKPAKVDPNWFGGKHPDSGTMIVFRRTRGLEWSTPSGLRSNLIKELGQTYRKFLLGGKTIKIDGKRIKPYDPLMLTPSALHVDKLGLGDQNFMVWNPISIKNPVTNKESVINIRTSLLDVAKIDELTNKEKTQHKINYEGSGFYIVRGNREIARGQKFHGIFQSHADLNYFRIELQFSPELDELFSIQTNKSRFSPQQSLRDILKPLCQPLKQTCKDTLAEIRAESKRKKSAAVTKATRAEQAAAEAMKTVRSLPDKRSKKEREKITEQAKRDLESAHAKNPKQARRKLDVFIQEKRPFMVDVESAPGSAFYRVQYAGDTSIVWINMAHPFYSRIYEVATQDQDLQDSLDLLLFALAKAEIEAIKIDDTLLAGFYKREKHEWSLYLEALLGAL